MASDVQLRERSAAPLREVESMSQSEWMQRVYQADQVPQFTWRAIVVGALLGIPLAIANLYTLLRIGWSFGVTITACVLAFGTWRVLRTLSVNRIKPLTPLEAVSIQAAASAAGYATGGTAAIAFGALLLLTGARPSAAVMFSITILTAFLGVLIAIPLKQWLINRESLPFPSGVLTAETIRGLCERSAATLREARALVVSLLVGSLLALLRIPGAILDAPTAPEAWTKRIALFPAWLRWPAEVALPYPGRLVGVPKASVLGFSIEPSLLLVGAGLVIGMRIAFSMLLSAVLLYFVITPWLMRSDARLPEDAPAALAPVAENLYEVRRWSVWPGTALLLASSITGFLLEIPALVRRMTAGTENTEDAAVARVEAPLRWTLVGIPVCIVPLAWMLRSQFDIPVYASLITILLAILAAVIAGRVTGETDNTPVGPVTKLTQAGMALLARGQLAANVVSGGVAAGAAQSSADLLQDMKTARLLGADPRRVLAAQLIGAVVGAATVVFVWRGLFPDAASVDALGSPPIMITAAASTTFVEGWSAIPPKAASAALIATVLGCVLAVAERAPGMRRWLPSPIGLGMGWIFPFSNVLAFVLGAVIGLVWTRVAPRTGERYQLAAASGAVAGESLVFALLYVVLAMVALQQG